MTEHNLIDTPEQNKPGKSVVLQTLCLLTWIGSGLQMVGSLAIAGIAGANPDGKTNEQLSFILLLFLISGILCLAGSIVMWKRRRWGFYVYAAGQIGPTVLLVYMIAVGHTTAGLNMGSFVTVCGLLFPILFSFLYARELQLFRLWNN